MAINKFMKAAIKAISYANFDVKDNYRLGRKLDNIVKPSIKLLYKLSDYRIVSDGSVINVRRFEPKKTKSNDVLVFFHGGGWVIGNIDSYTAPCAALADNTGRRVLSVDYRLAPEYPFPCAVNDCYAAVKRIVSLEENYGIDPENVVLIGDSAGGNLAAAVSLMARDKGEFNVKRQILIYPSTYNDHTENSPFKSIRENGEDYLLTSKRICDYTEHYIQYEADWFSPYFAPLLCEDLSNQPDTLLITAEYDALRDEGEAYGRKLREAGNNVSMYRMKDALHGFFTLPPRYVHVRNCFLLINRFLER